MTSVTCRHERTAPAPDASRTPVRHALPCPNRLQRWHPEIRTTVRFRQEITRDLAIRNVTIVDGTGARPGSATSASRTAASSRSPRRPTGSDGVSVPSTGPGLMPCPGFVDPTPTTTPSCRDPTRRRRACTGHHGDRRQLRVHARPAQPGDGDYVRRMMAIGRGACRWPRFGGGHRLGLGDLRRPPGPLRREPRGQRRVPGRPLRPGAARSWAPTRSGPSRLTSSCATWRELWSRASGPAGSGSRPRGPARTPTATGSRWRRDGPRSRAASPSPRSSPNTPGTIGVRSDGCLTASTTMRSSS